jgi:dephospho-CoA kinase
MNNVSVVALVGMPGAGKSVCTEYIVGKGFPSVYFGGIALEEVRHRGMELNEANEKIVREDIRAQEGKDAFAKRILKQMDELFAAGSEKIVVDGIYSWTEYKIFKERFGESLAVIAVTAPRHIRHQRLTNRPIRPLTEQEITQREYAEIENLEKGGPIANADFTLVNDDESDNLLKKLDKLLHQINF